MLRAAARRFSSSGLWLQQQPARRLQAASPLPAATDAAAAAAAAAASDLPIFLLRSAAAAATAGAAPPPTAAAAAAPPPPPRHLVLPHRQLSSCSRPGGGGGESRSVPFPRRPRGFEAVTGGGFSAVACILTAAAAAGGIASAAAAADGGTVATAAISGPQSLEGAAAGGPAEEGGGGDSAGPRSESEGPLDSSRTTPTGWGQGDLNPYSHPGGDQGRDAQGLVILPCPKANAPRVPPPISRTQPAHLILDLTTTTEELSVSPLHKYTFWTFDGRVPGPIMRARVGDVLEVRYTNKDRDGIGHNIDFHSVEGPGGGAPVLYAEEGETKVATFKLLTPGLFNYHCAAAPLPTHIANGMYGLFIVEPEGGLPPVDKEFYVVQSEIYAEESGTPGLLDHSYFQGLAEAPMYVVLNGAQGQLTEVAPLLADQDDSVRIYFGNAGPNLTSAFHIIGTAFVKLHRDGDLTSPPAQNVTTTCVPPGGSCVVDLRLPVPGNYTLLDHAIFRVDKGCVGFLKVRARGNDRRRDLYDSLETPTPCPGCKLHG
ncbi:hypothetical protein PLESTB_000627000 [Pleodorina starrii]|uniref:Copper-containing nitrite reductase n=1 Tax=Pleodorina starrii TaxID=330485 RepID=A0A9W6BIV8_9CHLO|nr:hypothetical protein PLESTB_000627000 [Pleodorina starrii]